MIGSSEGQSDPDRATVGVLSSLVSSLNAFRAVASNVSFAGDFNTFLESERVTDENITVLRAIALFGGAQTRGLPPEDNMIVGARQILALVAKDELDRGELRRLLIRAIEALLELTEDAEDLSRSSEQLRDEVEPLLAYRLRVSESEPFLR